MIQRLFVTIFIALPIAGLIQAQIVNPNGMPRMAYQLSSVSRYGDPYFANFLLHDGQNWRDSATNQTIPRTSPQMSRTGNPLYLNPGQILVAGDGGMEGLYHEPSTAPDRDKFLEGQVVLSWKGDADIRLTAGGTTLLSGNGTGLLADGRRVYLTSTATKNLKTQIFAINPANPPTNIRLSLPDPANPQINSLETEIFHPSLIARLQDRSWSYIRLMDWAATNGNPQQDWSDRRLPADCFFDGVINPRNPAPGWVRYNGSNGPVYASANRPTGVPFEIMIALANQTGRNLWINVPHLATNDFLTKMAQVFRYGSDGVNPYTSTQANPVWAPLNSNLNIYLEFSNEVWQTGVQDAFVQAGWCRQQATAASLSHAVYVAQKTANAWQRFEAVLGAGRIVRIAAGQGGGKSYNEDLLAAFHEPSAGLPLPEAVSYANYYNANIHFWVNEQPWFTSMDFGAEPWKSSYWSSPQLEADLNRTFDHWNFLMLSDYASSGGDLNEIGNAGGFGNTNGPLAYSYNLPVIAYEGGPALVTEGNGLDVSNATNGITLFVKALNRHPRFAEAFNIHVNKAFERGMVTAIPLADSSKWSKFGQWGSLEYLGQDITTSPRWQALLSWYDESSILRCPYYPLNAVPSFATSATLPRAEVGLPYGPVTLAATGGNGALSYKLIGASLVPGLYYDSITRRIYGTPTSLGANVLYVRVKDTDGDAAWRTFKFDTVQRTGASEVVINFQTLTPSATTSLAEPLVVGDYSFRSIGSSQSGAALRAYGTSDGYPSTVLGLSTTSARHLIARTDGSPFDLFALDVGSHNASSAKIVATYPLGLITTSIVNFPVGATNRTEAVLDLVGCISIEISWHELPDATGSVKRGAIDNLVFNRLPDSDSFLAQDFSSGGLVSDYVNSVNPGSIRFTGINSSSPGQFEISNGALRFIGSTGSGRGSIVRNEDFPGPPDAMVVSFDLEFTGNTFAKSTALQLNIGDGFSNGTSSESASKRHSTSGIDLTATPGQFKIGTFLFSGRQTCTWVVNNSGSSLDYTGPNGTTRTLANDRNDLWIGTTLTRSTAAPTTATLPLHDFKMLIDFGGDSSSLLLDNIEIYRPE